MNEETKSQANFNSHPHEEDDEVFWIRNIERGTFNSHPHEEDDVYQH